MRNEARRKQNSLTAQRTRHLLNCPIPAIAAANHAACGGACEGEVAVDLSADAKPARFALTEPTGGTHPDAGGRQNLARACVLRMAKEITLTGLHFNAWDVALMNFNETCQPVFTEQ